jgi:hypothetical protein
MTLPTPHNNLFSFTLSHIASARSLVETRFPPKVVSILDLDKLEILQESFIDPSLKEKYSDVLPMVVYHGESAWNEPTSIGALLDSPEELDEYQVHFSFPLLDLTQTAEESITGEPFLQSMLRLLKYGRSQELLERLKGIFESLQVEQRSHILDSWIVAIGVYVMSVNKVITDEFLTQTINSVWPVQIEPGSLADRIRSER